MNYSQVTTLLSYLREIAADAPNKPDLELACDFIEVTYPDVDLTNSNVIDNIAERIDINFWIVHYPIHPILFNHYA